MTNNRKKRHRKAPNATQESHSLIYGIAITLAVSIGASLFLSLIFSLFANTLSDPLNYLDGFGIASLLLSGFVSGFICMKFFADSKALAAVLFACAIRIALSFCAKLLFSSVGTSLSLPPFLLFSLLFVVASIGGAFLGKTERKRRKRTHRRA